MLGDGRSLGAQGGKEPSSTFVFAPGRQGLSGVGFWSGTHSENFDMSIWPFCCVGRHGFDGCGSSPTAQDGKVLRSTFVLAPGLHGLSGVGFWSVSHAGNLEMSI